ncbi:hypothetical protein SK128_020121, partial [Halocaridina rubra]
MVLIEGPMERYIQRGSVLALTCVIHHPRGQPPNQVLWFHGTINIDYDSPRGGISVQTEIFPKRTISKVIVSNVKKSDTGEYSCSPSDYTPAVTYVHVQNGQQDAAVQQVGLSSALLSSSRSQLIM